MRNQILTAISGVFFFAGQSFADLPTFQGRWHGECVKVVGQTERKLKTYSDKLKIVQYGTVGLKIDGKYHESGVTETSHQNIFGISRSQIATTCDFKGSDEFSCSTRYAAALRATTEAVRFNELTEYRVRNNQLIVSSSDSLGAESTNCTYTRR
ncbi:hypothetical protein EB061_01290 [bacterium]|jgi:hypothetical protein|nr:hypothetical protein [bacterium]